MNAKQYIELNEYLVQFWKAYNTRLRHHNRIFFRYEDAKNPHEDFVLKHFLFCNN